VSVDQYAPGCHISTHTTTYYIEFYQPKPKLARNSEVTDELIEDSALLPKHVGAAKLNNKLIRTDTFVGYS
jgi:hypothetical protein